MILLNCWPATRDIYIYKTKQNIEGRRARKARSSFSFFVQMYEPFVYGGSGRYVHKSW